jgi:two-component system response regulator AtoC
VLIEGESGTGKEVLARAIHARSCRRTRVFRKISCSAGALSSGLDRMVFGETSAASIPETAPSQGRAADALGTVLFDDIDDLDIGVQARLIDLLQDDRFSGTETAGIQTVCTTKAPLRPKLDSGSFRVDLFYRINVVHLSLPPLRERRMDIPALSFHFLKVYENVYQRHPGSFSQRLMDVLLAAAWPGNIRELENAIKRYIVLGDAEPIIAELEKDGSAKAMAHTAGECSLKVLRRNAVRDCEYTVILTSLNRNHWNRRKTARELNISYRSLLYRMGQLGLRGNEEMAPLPVNAAGRTS